MKNRLLNIVCGILITASLVVIARSAISMNRKQNRSVPQHESVSKVADPLTEVVFDDVLINVGAIPKDTTIYQSYTLRNSGTQPLVVYHVDPDCNCTNFELSSKIAMPNDSILIHLTVETKEKRLGMFMLNTVVKVNTQKQLYRLRLVGEVVKR